MTEVATTRLRVQMGRGARSYLCNGDAGDREQPPTINFGIMRSPRNSTLEIRVNIGSSRPKCATRPMEHRAISGLSPHIAALMRATCLETATSCLGRFARINGVGFW